MQGDSFVSLTGAETLTNKTLTSPVLNGTQMTPTGAIVVPIGTTAQRPGTGVTGMIRFNSTLDYFEGWNGASWIRLGVTMDATNYGLLTDSTNEADAFDRGLITDTDVIS
jgi:hypothetical protein